MCLIINAVSILLSSVADTDIPVLLQLGKEQAMDVYRPISEGLLVMVKEGAPTDEYKAKAEEAINVLNLKYTPPSEEEAPEEDDARYAQADSLHGLSSLAVKLGR